MARVWAETFRRWACWERQPAGPRSCAPGQAPHSSAHERPARPPWARGRPCGPVPLLITLPYNHPSSPATKSQDADSPPAYCTGPARCRSCPHSPSSRLPPPPAPIPASCPTPPCPHPGAPAPLTKRHAAAEAADLCRAAAECAGRQAHVTGPLLLYPPQLLLAHHADPGLVGQLRAGRGSRESAPTQLTLLACGEGGEGGEGWREPAGVWGACRH